MKEGADSYLPKEEMGRITTFLIDILKSQGQGESAWESWRRQVTSSYFDRKWGRDWKSHDKEFWEKFSSGKLDRSS
jgi:hypothetical protein